MNFFEMFEADTQKIISKESEFDCYDTPFSDVFLEVSSEVYLTEIANNDFKQTQKEIKLKNKRFNKHKKHLNDYIHYNYNSGWGEDLVKYKMFKTSKVFNEDEYYDFNTNYFDDAYYDEYDYYWHSWNWAYYVDFSGRVLTQAELNEKLANNDFNHYEMDNWCFI